MKSTLLAFSAVALSACASTMNAPASSDGGLVRVKSAHSAKTTMDRFEAAVKAKSMNVFARVDHAAGAQRINKTLRPTEVLIWGSPQGGTPLMGCAQTVGIDLPQKTLVWQDANGDVFLAYNDPAHLLQRAGGAGCEAVIANVRSALTGFAKEASQP